MSQLIALIKEYPKTTAAIVLIIIIIVVLVVIFAKKQKEYTEISSPQIFAPQIKDSPQITQTPEPQITIPPLELEVTSPTTLDQTEIDKYCMINKINICDYVYLVNNKTGITLHCNANGATAVSTCCKQYSDATAWRFELVEGEQDLYYIINKASGGKMYYRSQTEIYAPAGEYSSYNNKFKIVSTPNSSVISILLASNNYKLQSMNSKALFSSSLTIDESMKWTIVSGTDSTFPEIASVEEEVIKPPEYCIFDDVNVCQDIFLLNNDDITLHCNVNGQSSVSTCCNQRTIYTGWRFQLVDGTIDMYNLINKASNGILWYNKSYGVVAPPSGEYPPYPGDSNCISKFKIIKESPDVISIVSSGDSTYRLVSSGSSVSFEKSSGDDSKWKLVQAVEWEE